MGIDLQTNVSALVAESNFNMSQSAIQGSFEKLSSGYRINSAADDAAGLGISKAMNAQVQSYGMAESRTRTTQSAWFRRRTARQTRSTACSLVCASWPSKLRTAR